MVRYKLVAGNRGYRIGDDGSVWTCLRKVGLGDGGGVKYEPGLTWTELVPTIHKSGHLWVRLRGNRRYVHRLVLEAFVGPRPDKMEACHFPDRNPANNHVTNLRWATHQDNIHDQREHGTDNAGERNGQAKMTVEKVKQLRADVASGMTCADAARKQGICRTQARRIVARQRWQHVS